jgi:hypothetical protein
MTALDFLSDVWRRPHITFRIHGDKGQYRKPMYHRFNVKGGASLVDIMAQNVTRHNALYDRLLKRGRG